MASATTVVIPVRVTHEMMEEIQNARFVSLGNDSFEGEGTVSDWIRKALREVLDKPKRARESYQRKKVQHGSSRKSRKTVSGSLCRLPSVDLDPDDYARGRV